MWINETKTMFFLKKMFLSRQKLMKTERSNDINWSAYTSGMNNLHKPYSTNISKNEKEMHVYSLSFTLQK